MSTIPNRDAIAQLIIAINDHAKLLVSLSLAVQQIGKKSGIPHGITASSVAYISEQLCEAFPVRRG
jgi:hypothetical protein